MDNQERIKQELDRLKRENSNPLILAIMEDYAETISKSENKPAQEIIDRIWGKALTRELKHVSFN